MKVSVIVPVFNAKRTLPGLLDSFKNQTLGDFEIILVDDGSKDGTPSLVPVDLCHLIRLPENRGPAYCRNLGARNAVGDILAFTDSDCKVGPSWVERIRGHFSQNDAEAIMGKLVLEPSTFLGDAISALGFPAGGAVGFDKIWKVDGEGFTRSLSSCNCALRRDVFWEVGGFDESFPYAGGEDSLLAYHLTRMNHRIRYCPDVVAYHGARHSMTNFVKWQFRRGISSFIFSTKVGNRSDFFSLRLWSTGNIIRSYYKDRKFPLILYLLGTSLFVQLIGYLSARYNRDDYACPHH